MDNGTIFEVLKELLQLRDIYNINNNNKPRVSIDAFRINIAMSISGIVCSVSGNEKIIDEFGLKDWFDETAEMAKPVIVQQSAKLTEILREKYGLEFTDSSSDRGQEIIKTANEIFGK
jgi:hypothetical protein